MKNRGLPAGRQGFTLIELVVVMAIIGVLTGLATFNFQQARQRARDVQRKNDLKQLANALEVYKGDQKPQTYPASDQLSLLVTNKLMKELPVDPRYKTDVNAWVDYGYTLDPLLTGDTLDYELTACLENKGDLEKVPDSTCGPNGDGVTYKLTTP